MSTTNLPDMAWMGLNNPLGYWMVWGSGQRWTSRSRWHWIAYHGSTVVGAGFTFTRRGAIRRAQKALG